MPGYLRFGYYELDVGTATPTPTPTPGGTGAGAPGGTDAWGGLGWGGFPWGGESATPPDFLAALQHHWLATPALAAISPELFFGVAPPGPCWPDGAFYPVAVLTQIAGKVNLRNTGKGYGEQKFYRIAVYHPRQDLAAMLGDTAATLLDRLIDHPLEFTSGYQMTFYRMDDDLAKVANTGPDDATYVWCQSYTYRCQVGRTRVP